MVSESCLEGVQVCDDGVLTQVARDERRVELLVDRLKVLLLP